MKKLFIFILLCLISSSALADTSSVFNPDTLTNHVDMSVFYLNQLFGQVGNTLTGNGSQMLGHLFYIFNMGILAVGGVVIAYSILLSIIRMASEGVVIQTGKSTLFTLLKLVIGIALIIPTSNKNDGYGYSVLQGVVMKVVVLGVGLADSIWDNGLDYMQSGGALWVAPAKKAGDQKQNFVNTTNLKALFGKDSLGTQIFQSEVCMLASQDKANDAGVSMSKVKMTEVNYPSPDSYKDSEFQFGGYVNGNVDPTACGTVSWQSDLVCGVGGHSHDACTMNKLAISGLITTLTPLATQYYCKKQGDGDGTICPKSTKVDLNDLASEFLTPFIHYYSAVQISAVYNSQTDNNVPDTSYIENAKKEGWLLAGRYYWDIMRLDRGSVSADSLSSWPSSTQKSTQDSTLNKDAVESAGSYVSDNSKGSLSVINNLTTQINELDTQSNAINSKFKPSQKAIYVGQDSVLPLTASVGIGLINPGLGATMGALFIGMASISSYFKDFNSDYHGNPILFLMMIGKHMLDLAVSLWFLGGIAIAASTLAQVAMSGPFTMCEMVPVVAWGKAALVLLKWLAPIFIMLTVAIWGAGFFLYYYVPLYPFMIFLFASVGWFIAVIEAMVAAPLVALGLTHPENHDLLGKSEQAVMLLLSVFIQPALLVIGLFAGMILSFVSFQLLIYTFSVFLVDGGGKTVGSGNGSGNGYTSSMNIVASVKASPLYAYWALFQQPLLLVVFCYLIYILLTQSFSLIYLLRDSVLRWIGVQAGSLGSSPDQLAGQAREVISGFGSQAGKTLGDTAGGSGAGAEAYYENEKDKAVKLQQQQQGQQN